jgi:hypothetical protein
MNPFNDAGRRSRPVAMVDCPECGLPAEVLDRHVLESTSGPVEHVRIRCVLGSPFLIPTSRLES